MTPPQLKQPSTECSDGDLYTRDYLTPMHHNRKESTTTYHIAGLGYFYRHLFSQFL